MSLLYVHCVSLLSLRTPVFHYLQYLHLLYSLSHQYTDCYLFILHLLFSLFLFTDRSLFSFAVLIVLSGGSIYAFLGLLCSVILVCKHTYIYVILTTRYAEYYACYFILKVKYYPNFCISPAYVTLYHFRTYKYRSWATMSNFHHIVIIIIVILVVALVVVVTVVVAASVSI